jgi:hypothetical protein
MIRKQVELPDHLYAEAQRISREYEMSFAEVILRGVENLAPSFPPRSGSTPPRKVSSKKWSPPKPRDLGFKGLTHQQLKDTAQMSTVEEDLIKARRK